MKDSILERLLEQGHISILYADILLNGPNSKKVDIIKSLLEDGPINDREAIILLKDKDTPQFPFGVPNQTVPVMPLNYPPYNPWIGNPGTGTPYWTVSCSNDLNKNNSEK